MVDTGEKCSSDYFGPNLFWLCTLVLVVYATVSMIHFQEENVLVYANTWWLKIIILGNLKIIGWCF